MRRPLSRIVATLWLAASAMAALGGALQAFGFNSIPSYGAVGLALALTGTLVAMGLWRATKLPLPISFFVSLVWIPAAIFVLQVASGQLIPLQIAVLLSAGSASLLALVMWVTWSEQP